MQDDKRDAIIRQHKIFLRLYEYVDSESSAQKGMKFSGTVHQVLHLFYLGFMNPEI